MFFDRRKSISCPLNEGRLERESNLPFCIAACAAVRTSNLIPEACLGTASVQKWHASVTRDRNSNSMFHLGISKLIVLKDFKDNLPSLSFVLVKGYPRAWQEFWEPVYSFSRQFGVEINVALEVFKLIYECVSKEEEGRPLSTGS